MWLQDTIINGFARLIALRLQNCPPEDAVEISVTVWVEVLSHKFYDLNEKQDRKRIEQAFLQLCAECERFPTPKMLIDRMQPREIVAIEPPKFSEQDRLRAVENLAKIKANLQKVGQKMVINNRRKK